MVELCLRRSASRLPLAWPGLAWLGLGWPFGTPWLAATGFPWPGLAWSVLVWLGLASPGLALAGQAWRGVALHFYYIETLHLNSTRIGKRFKCSKNVDT